MSWTQGPKNTPADPNNEQSWVLLGSQYNQQILTIDTWGEANNNNTAELYTAVDGDIGSWAQTTGAPPQVVVPGRQMGDDEIGAGLLLPNGKAVFFGSNGATALYDPSQSSWSNMDAIPNNYQAFDAPAAMMFNGKILCAVNIGDFTSSAHFYEFDYTQPAGSQFTSVATPSGFNGVAPVYCRMLVLPNGQVLMSEEDSRLFIYTPDGSPLTAGKPGISSVTLVTGRTYTLNGTLLNGISEGAAFGDDAEMSSNYPIVYLYQPIAGFQNGTYYFARTFNWSYTGVQTGSQAETTEFTIPSSVPTGSYTLYVVANGISSSGFSFTLTAGGGASLPPGGGPGGPLDEKVVQGRPLLLTPGAPSPKNLGNEFPSASTNDASVPSSLRIGVADFVGCGETSDHKEVCHEQEVHRSPVG